MAKKKTSRPALSALLFGQEQQSPARADVEVLHSLLRKNPPPVACTLIHGYREYWHTPYQTVLLFPAVADEAMLGHVTKIGFVGGLNLASGRGAAEDFLAQGIVLKTIRVAAKRRTKKRSHRER